VTAVVALLPGVGGSQTATPYKIGVTFPLTGPLATNAAEYLPAAEIAVADINRAGGVKGHPLQLVVEDTAGTPEGGVAAMRKVVQVDGVQAVLTIYTNVVTAQIPLADQLKVPFLSPVEAPNLVNRGQYSFSHASSVIALTPLMRDYWRATHVKRVFSIVVNNAFGPVLAGVSRTAADAIGAQLSETTFNTGGGDYRGLVARAKDFNPDAIWLGSQGALDETIIIKELREAGVTAPIFDAGIFYTEPAWRAGVGTYVDGIVMAGLTIDDVAGRDFIAAFRARTGHTPGYPSGEVYDIVRMFAAAIARSSYNGGAIRDALATLKGVPSVFGGTIAMDDQHYSIPTNEAMWRVRGEKLVRVTPRNP